MKSEKLDDFVFSKLLGLWDDILFKIGISSKFDDYPWIELGFSSYYQDNVVNIEKKLAKKAYRGKCYSKKIGELAYDSKLSDHLIHETVHYIIDRVYDRWNMKRKHEEGLAILITTEILLESSHRDYAVSLVADKYRAASAEYEGEFGLDSAQREYVEMIYSLKDYTNDVDISYSKGFVELAKKKDKVKKYREFVFNRSHVLHR